MEERDKIGQALRAVTGRQSTMDLRAALAYLDAVDRSRLDREFVHFLANRSYVKALAWLEGERVEHRHGH